MWKYTLKLTLMIIVCTVFASCDNNSNTPQEPFQMLDVNDYNYYFLVAGVKYHSNDTIHLMDNTVKWYNIQILNEEGVEIYNDKKELVNSGNIITFYKDGYGTEANYRLNIRRHGIDKICVEVGNFESNGYKQTKNQ